MPIDKSMKAKRILRNILIGIGSFLLILIIALQVIFSSKVLTGIVNRFAADYIEGELVFDRVKASALRSFPYLRVDIDGCSLTYPHDRYAAYDSLRSEGLAGRRFSLTEAGRGETMDTLASFHRFSASVNYLSFIKGTIDIHAVELDRPRIFAHYFDSTAASWDILPLSSKEKDTTKKTTLPEIAVSKISLSKRPFFVFTAPADTLFGLFTMKDLAFRGKVLTTKPLDSKVKLTIDSLFVSGRLPSDTLAFALDRFRLGGDKDDMALDAAARAFLRTNAFGRMILPIGLAAKGGISEDEASRTLRLNSMNLKVSALELSAFGEAVLYGDSTYVKAEAIIDDCPVGELVEEFTPNFPFLEKLTTDARLSLTALADGYWNPSRNTLPELVAELVIPRSEVDYEDLGRKGHLSLDATAETDGALRLDAGINDLSVDIVGMQLHASGSGEDLLGEDPALGVEAHLNARVDSLTHAFTRKMGISGTGRITADLKGDALMSQLNAKDIGDADINGDIRISGLRVNDRKDTISAYIPRADIKIAAEGNRIDRNMKQGARVLSLAMDIDTADVTMKESMFIRSGKLSLKAQNSAGILSKGMKAMTPLMGVLQGKNLSLRDGNETSVFVRDTKETFRITPATRANPSPKLALSGNIGAASLRSGENRIGAKDLNLGVTASMNKEKAEQKSRRKHLLDSLQRVYPGVPKDSLFIVWRAERKLPDWLQEEEFRKHDISIRLDESIAKYFREWNINGTLGLDKAFLMTPKYPLRNRVSKLSGSFDNDRIALGNVTLQSGDSDISGKITLKGLRRAITTGRGIYDLDAKITSNHIDVNEIMRAFAYMKTYDGAASDEALNETATDEQFQASIDAAELPDSTGSTLIVLPANVNARVTLEAGSIKYDSLHITWAASDIAMKQRCLQITNTVAESNMGDIYFEGFYSSKTKDDLKAGFDLNMVDITAEKVITLMPKVDTILPMLKSFSGMLDCELAATTKLDQNMNLILPSIDGVMKIYGSDLTLENSQEFAKIAKYLLFRNRKKAVIDRMSVEGIIRENVLEVFPFVLEVDRYTLAASGVQNFNDKFRYHISVINSPLLVKFGVNVHGNDFDHIKFGLGKALYRNTKVPVFTQELNSMQVNLVSSIHNIFELGVDKAIAENRAINAVEEKKNAEGYSMETSEELSEEEKAALKAAEKAQEEEGEEGEKAE